MCCPPTSSPRAKRRPPTRANAEETKIGLSLAFFPSPVAAFAAGFVATAAPGAVNAFVAGPTAATVFVFPSIRHPELAVRRAGPRSQKFAQRRGFLRRNLQAAHGRRVSPVRTFSVSPTPGGSVSARAPGNTPPPATAPAATRFRPWPLPVRRSGRSCGRLRPPHAPATTARDWADRFRPVGPVRARAGAWRFERRPLWWAVPGLSSIA